MTISTVSSAEPRIDLVTVRRISVSKAPHDVFSLLTVLPYRVFPVHRRCLW
jgi:hypothetical protein